MRKWLICLAVLALASGACGKKADTVSADGTPAPETTSNVQTCKHHTPKEAKTLDAAPKSEPKIKVPDGAPPCDLVKQDLLAGDGDEAKVSSTVSAKYVGVSWSTGQRFDGNWSAEGISFPLSGVIKGWQEGIPGMKVGGVRRLTIPADLAYGDTPPQGSGIAPGETLIFVVQLVKVS